MRILKALIGSLAAASICTLAQARVIDKSANYTNPDTVPVLIKIPSVLGSETSGYYDLPNNIDLSIYYKEFTTPGPLLTFTVNTPTTTSYGTSVPNTFKMQLWWLDPTPDNPVDDDSNYDVDDDDTRTVFQNLDLEEPSDIAYLLVNAVGHSDGDIATMPGTLFWRVSSYTFSEDETRPVVIESGIYKLATDDTSHVTLAGCTWTSPNFNDTTYTAGTVALYYYSTEGTYSLFYNLEDNTDIITAGMIATIGQIDDAGLETLKTIAGVSDNYELATTREVSSTFTFLPLWNTYTDDDFDLYKQPDRSDFVQITDIKMSDPSGTYPTHGLKFIEDQPYSVTTTDDDDNETTTITDPNAAIKELFDVSITEDGIFSYKKRDDVTYSSSTIGYHTFYYRVYVNDGTNNGLAGTDYFRGSAYVYLYFPLTIYFSDAAYSSSVDYSTTDNPDNVWYWFNSSTYGWFMEKDFPSYRWVYSYEHGWMYLCDDRITSTDGVYWYNARLNEPDGTTTYNDDEVGWLWTRSDMFPSMYSFKDGGWVYYLKDVDSDTSDNDDTDDYVERILDKRLFWSYRQKAYITPDGNDTTYGTKTFSINGRKFGTGL